MAIGVTTDLVDVNLAEAITNYAVLGTFATAIAASPDTYVQGSNNVGGRVSAATGWAHTSLASTDLTLSERHVFQWLKSISIPQLDTKANGGLAVTISSDATPTLTGTSPNDGPTNSKSWFVGGNTDALSGWVCYVVDPQSTPSLTLGSPTISAIQRIGVRGKVVGVVGAGAVRPINVTFDATRYGTGLTYTGDDAGTPGTFANILMTAMSVANAWGILTFDSSIYFGAGKFDFGTTGQTAISSFKSIGQLFVWRNFPVANTFYAWRIRGAGSFATTFQLGNYASGLVSGGNVIKGAGDPSSSTHAVWTLDVGTNTTVNLYGSQFSELRSSTLQSTTTICSCTFLNFGTITTNGALIDNCTFQDVKTTAPISGTNALVVASATEMSTVTNSKFVNCNNAIKITAAGSYTFTGDTFSGNTYDVENSAAATDAVTQTDTRDTDQALGNGTITEVGESFVGNGGSLANVVFTLSKTGSPTGNLTAKIYAHSGVYGTSSVPTGTPLATSPVFDVSTLTTTPTATTIFFASQNQNITLTNATNYVVTLEYSGGNASNYVNVGIDSTSPTWGGNLSTYTSPTWTADGTKDAIFKVRTGGVVTITPVSGSNPSASKVLNSNAIPGCITINTGVNVTVHVQDTNQAYINGARVNIFQTSNPGNVLLNALTSGTGDATASITLTAGTGLTIRVRKSSTGSTRYLPAETNANVPSVDTPITVILNPDTIASA